MSAFDFYQRQVSFTPSYSGNNELTLGERLKHQSDDLMETTWWNDIQSKVCYIYDFFHDDQKELNKGMDYINTTKMKIDAKFIITQYSSISKDQVEYHIMFRPSQPVEFTEKDDLYYYQTDFYDRYGAEFPIGLYIDIPDDKGIYNKWLICMKEIGNQFIKYKVLPCNYYFMWIEQNGNRRIKRKMWGVRRTQSSYNSGEWTDRYFTSQENQAKIWLPMNIITEKLFYVNQYGDNKKVRVLVSALTKNPIAWSISKVENAEPFGIQKLTLNQDSFNSKTDYVNIETKEMFADYYSSNIEPDIIDNPNSDNPDNTPTNLLSCKIYASTNYIKVGGSYKLLTAKFYDHQNEEVTQDFLNLINIENWKCFIDGKDISHDSSLITWLGQKENNKIKIKFNNNRSYLNKILTIQCITRIDDKNIVGELKFDLII